MFDEILVGKWMTRSEVRARNKILAPLGKRICTKHQGVALPLTDKYFYHMTGAEPPFRPSCKACCNETVRQCQHRRYHNDPEFAAKQREQSRQARIAKRQRKLMHIQKQLRSVNHERQQPERQS